jgi:hypothetical protein
MHYHESNKVRSAVEIDSAAGAVSKAANWIFEGKEATMKSTLRSGYGFGCALATAALLVANAQAAPVDPVVWDTASAIANGSGCTSAGPFPDTFFITAGDDVSVIFSRMGVDLTPNTASNTGVTGCLVRIPVVIDGATAVSEIDQTLLWGWAKSLGSVGQIAAKTTFCSLPTTAISSTVPETVAGVQALEETSTQSFLVWPPSKPFCQGKQVKCLFQANIGVAAMRQNSSQDISIRVFGEDIEYEALAYWQMCPSS